jgi:hypothetical protein
MPRPYDYGDQFPSDTGDTKPSNPIDDLTEIAYRVGSNPTIDNLEQFRNIFDPEEEAPVPEKASKTTWSGIVIEFVETRGGYHYYTVQREDLITVTASTTYREYEEWIRPGTTVTILENQNSGYTIVGQIQRDEFTYWAKLNANLNVGKTVDATLYYFDRTTLTWVTDNETIKVKNNSTQTWLQNEQVQVRKLYDGENPNDPVYNIGYFDPIASGGGNTVTIIIGQCVADVTGGGTFYIDNIDLVTGTDPRNDPEDPDEQVLIKNTFGQNYTETEKVIAFQRSDSVNFETEKIGESSSYLIHFELITNLTTAGTSAQAQRVKADGTKDTSETFYVLDNSARFGGWATRSTDRGFRGYAEWRMDDYSGGMAGYDIVEMEQPTLGYIGSFFYKDGTTDPRVWEMNLSSPDYDRLVQQGEGRDHIGLIDGVTEIEAHDVRNITLGLNTTDWQELEVIWSDDEQEYVIVSINTLRYSRIKGQAFSTVDGKNTTEFNIDNIEVLAGDDPRDDPTSTSETVQVKNDPVLYRAQDDVVYATYDRSVSGDKSLAWTTADHGNEERAVIILAQAVNNVNGAQTPSFSADNVKLITGVDPRPAPHSAGQTVIFENTFDQIYKADDWIIGFYNESTQTFETDQTGGVDTTTIILASVKDNNVTSSDSIFQVDNINLVTGIDPRTDPQSTTETVTVNNSFAAEFTFGDRIIAFKRSDSPYFEPDRSSTSTSDITIGRTMEYIAPATGQLQQSGFDLDPAGITITEGEVRLLAVEDMFVTPKVMHDELTPEDPGPVEPIVETWLNVLLDPILANSIVIGATYRGRKVIIAVAPTTLQRP